MLYYILWLREYIVGRRDFFFGSRLARAWARRVLKPFWRPLVKFFTRPIPPGVVARVCQRFFWRPVGRFLWQPLVVALAFLWRPLLKTFAGLLFFSFFYWLPYTLSALLLGIFCLVYGFLWVCQKAGRHHPWHRRYRALCNFLRSFFSGCLFFLPLLTPVIYLSCVILFQYLCGLGHILAEAENLIQLPAPAVANPYRVGSIQAIFEVRLTSTGVSMMELRNSISAELVAYDRWIDRLSALQPELAMQPGLPTLEPPKPATPIIWPANWEQYTWWDCVRWLLWKCWPRLYAQHDPIDVGAVWLLSDPQDPIHFDVRWGLNKGLQFNATLSLPYDQPKAGWGPDPYMVVFERGGLKMKPHYFHVKTAEELEFHWKLWHRPEEQSYRDGMAEVSRHFIEYPTWKAALLHRLSLATTFTELYEIHSEVCLQEAQLLFRWQFGCVDPAKALLAEIFESKKMQFELMHPWFCRENTFTSVGCEEIFQSWERSADATELWRSLYHFQIDKIDRVLGQLGRHSFYPLGAVKPTANEWGALFHYWEALRRPPLARDLDLPWAKLRDFILKGAELNEGQLDDDFWSYWNG